MMKRKYLHIAMHVAMNEFYDENNASERLIQLLSDTDPYIFDGSEMADLAIQDDFNKSMDRQNIGEEVDAKTAYNAVKNFLSDEYVYYSQIFPDEKAEAFDKLFSKYTLDEWQEIYDDVVDYEKNDRKS